MNKNLLLCLVALFMLSACDGKRSNTDLSDTSDIETYNEGEDEDSSTLKVGPKYDVWVQAQYANADYDYKSITNGKRFAVEDGITTINDLVDNVNRLEEIIDDGGYQISRFPDFYKTPKMAEKLNRNHKAAKNELQKRLPQYRKYYVKTTGQILWKHDIKVKSSGRTIWFIGAVFARNANILEFQQDQADNLRTLGFKKACYKWVDADVEYTYYNL